MGFLEDLGAGLRQGALAGAGALSKDVYQEQSRQREARATQGRAQNLAVAQHIMQAVHNGQVEDAYLPELQQQLSRMGYNIPMQAFGPSLEAKHTLAKYANEISKQKLDDAAGKALQDFKLFGGQQQGLTPDNTTGFGLAGRPGLSQLDAMMPKANPESSLGMDFTPDQFDQAPAQAPGMPPKLRGLPPPIVQTPAGMPASSLTGPADVQSFAYDPSAQTGQGLVTGNGQMAKMPPIPAGISPTDVQSFGYKTDAETARGLEPLPQIAPVPGAYTPAEGGEFKAGQADVYGRLPRGPQQSVALPAIPPQPPASPTNSQTGEMDLNDLYSKSMAVARRGLHGGKEVLDYLLKMKEAETKPDFMSVGEAQTVLDKRTGKIVLQGKPKTNLHVVDGALVDEAGNVVYKGSPEQLKVVQEFNAMLDAAGITDPVQRQQKWADYASRKGAGVTVNTGNVEDPRGKLPVNHRWKADGSGDVERIPGGPADELSPHQKQQVIGIQNTRFAISEYRDELNKMKTSDYASFNSRAKLESKYSAMILLGKEAFLLGVLNPNDRVILEEVVANPLGLRGSVLSKETLDEQTAQLDKIMSHMESAGSQIRPQDAQKVAPSAGTSAAPRKIMTIKSDGASAKDSPISKQPPPEMPKGSVFYKYSSRGNRVWKSPDGKLMEDME